MTEAEINDPSKSLWASENKEERAVIMFRDTGWVLFLNYTSDTRVDSHHREGNKA